MLLEVEMKQVIIMRTDLGMSVGKMCAQAAHAVKYPHEPVIVLQVSSEKELKDLLLTAKARHVTYTEVHDAGHTEVPPGTLTCGCIVAFVDNKVDRITGHLKLL